MLLLTADAGDDAIPDTTNDCYGSQHVLDAETTA